ncbi:N(G),N(G)-dimethylarginine dimethylaminohydrolase [Ornithinimicrobium ciconiae]|uniref:N(G),N(G)-dimethylarginine dimethylaminohydrolase n=1 Tax=Ornithinimicrobium ciconiae TaxID=2594265 RepID=A0A516G6R9_9MICO|nr:N(G),N(G)-dimethylarginine dimethylaminohydrolase [Ornithinimicrobium ciconiae]QDO87213.1 N(G),N(G)-dimethylarginine dimethylaminohydrolase [Ornithinimicrobium ciconiae]
MPRAFVRRPSPRLAEGLVTHVERSDSVDAGRALQQWEAYCAALTTAGYALTEVPPSPEHPDSVFVEDALVVVGDLAVVTAPGAPERSDEVTGVRLAAHDLGLTVVELTEEPALAEQSTSAEGQASRAGQASTEPAHLDGGDVLKVGQTLYVGVGGRTTSAGARALDRAVAGTGRTVTAVPIAKTLHLKSQVTALPDGTVVGYAPLVDDVSQWPHFLEVPEPEGAHVIALGEQTVLMSDAAPRSAQLFRSRGLEVVSLDVSEFVKVEGCVTCLSVRLHPWD